jgi:hypothetical protein
LTSACRRDGIPCGEKLTSREVTMADENDDAETESTTDDKTKAKVEPAPKTDWVHTIEIKRILVDDFERRDE